MFLLLNYLLFQLLIVALSVSKHLLFVQNKTITNKKSVDLEIFFTPFKILQKSITFVILSIFKTFRPWGNVRSHTKFRPDRFSRCDVYWLQTNKCPPIQAKFIYRYRSRIIYGAFLIPRFIWFAMAAVILKIWHFDQLAIKLLSSEFSYLIHM